MKTNKGKFNGYTLLEVLVSIAIFAAIVSVIYPSYFGTLNNIEYTESEAEIYQMARIAMERVTKDIGSVYIPSWAEEKEQNEDELIRQNCRPMLIKFLSCHPTKGSLLQRKLNLYLVRRAQRRIERQQQETRRILLKHDRQTNRLLAFSGHLE